MIDPNNITDYNRSIVELQRFLLFSIVVAGKNSGIQSKKLKEFLRLIRNNYVAHTGKAPLFPFTILQWAGPDRIEKYLRLVKMGQYNRIAKAFYQVAQIRDIIQVELEDLIKIQGIGPKTARFFLLHSFPNEHYAVLDTHILKFLRKHGFDAPKSTPQNNKTYRYWEIRFIELWEKLGKGLTLAEFDLSIWKQYSNKP